MQVYYKVLTNDLKSVIMHSSPTRYRLGKWVTPYIPYSKLFVFDTLEHAESFRGRHVRSQVIYEVVVKNPIRIKKICYWSTSNIKLKHFWKMRKNKKRCEHVVIIPALPGTVGCDAVKLLRRVS